MRLLLLFVLMVAGVGASAQEQNACVQDSQISGGDTRPWPWGSEIRFPWTRIQGIWAPVEGCDSYFVFKVTKQVSSGERFVQVTQYDPATCDKIASGLGIETDKIIRASMVSNRGAFDLTIRAFDTSILKNMSYIDSAEEMSTFAAPTSVVVVSVYPKKRWELRKSFQIQKVRTNTTPICE